MRHAIIAALAATALLAGCGDDEATTATTQTTTTATTTAATSTPTDTIDIEDFKYSPTPATVKAGTKIAIVNADKAPHTITDEASDRAVDSGTIAGGATKSVTFTKAGIVKYYCEFHRFMKGEVTVVE